MRLVHFLAFCVLAACGNGARDGEVRMTSMAVFDPARYEGFWYEVARMPDATEAGCANVTVEYQPNAEGNLTVTRRCARSGIIETRLGKAEFTAPARFQQQSGTRLTPYWVLWVDDGYRTAVVATPSRSEGWVLNRDAEIPEDRLQAARDVLFFNGFDPSTLVMIPQGAS